MIIFYMMEQHEGRRGWQQALEKSNIATLQKRQVVNKIEGQACEDIINKKIVWF